MIDKSQKGHKSSIHDNFIPWFSVTMFTSFFLMTKFITQEKSKKVFNYNSERKGSSTRKKATLN